MSRTFHGAGRAPGQPRNPDKAYPVTERLFCEQRETGGQGLGESHRTPHETLTLNCLSWPKQLFLDTLSHNWAQLDC